MIMRLKVSSAKWRPFCLGLNVLTQKQPEMHGCVPSTVTADVPMLKHQSISGHNAD